MVFFKIFPWRIGVIALSQEPTPILSTSIGRYQPPTKSCMPAKAFRHTLATDLLRKPDANLFMVKELLGHSDIKTTMEYLEADITGMRVMLNRRVV